MTFPFESSSKLYRSVSADRDFSEVLAIYAKYGARTVEKFAARLIETEDTIADAPLTGKAFEGSEVVRVMSVQDYPFAYYYYYDGGTPEVLAFAIQSEKFSDSDIDSLIRIRISELRAEGKVPMSDKSPKYF
jgi:plasmid stabilization system protein ParE